VYRDEQQVWTLSNNIDFEVDDERVDFAKKSVTKKSVMFDGIRIWLMRSVTQTLLDAEMRHLITNILVG
jgi:hypothetical protein